jgi:hypothetical protein
MLTLDTVDQVLARAFDRIRALAVVVHINGVPSTRNVCERGVCVSLARHSQVVLGITVVKRRAVDGVGASE